MHSLQMHNPAQGFPMDFVHAARALGRYDDTERDALLLAGIIPLATHPRVLDMCCGFGRMSHALHSMGFEVTGVDLSAEQISLAEKNHPGPSYRVADMRSPLPSPLDAVINMFTSFGYFDDEKQDIRALQAWFDALRPGGILVMELADMDRARAKLSREAFMTVRRTADVTEHCIMDWERRIFRVSYLQGERQFTCDTRLYEKEAIQAMLVKVGFKKVGLYGALDLRDKRPDDNLVVVAVK